MNGDGRLVRNGATLAAFHLGLTVWLFWRLPLSVPRGPNAIERAHQLLLAVMHLPGYVAAKLLPAGFEPLGLVLFVADALPWGFGTAYAVERLRRSLGRGRP